jgi:hypothetical protein
MSPTFMLRQDGREPPMMILLIVQVINAVSIAEMTGHNPRDAT